MGPAVSTTISDILRLRPAVRRAERSKMPLKLAISTMSLGRCYAGHSLEHRLDLAQRYGYQGIEVFYEDLAHLAQQLSPSATAEPSAEYQVAAARQIRQMCTTHNLFIVCLQPFMHFGGILDRKEHAKRLEELALWIQLAHALETDMISIPSSFLPQEKVSQDLDLIVADFQEAADLAARASPPVRLAYESLAWGTYSDTWERSWEIVMLVDRANFGLCLDSFNIAARLYADPAVASGRTHDAEDAVKQSMMRLVAEVDVQKLFYVQIVDAERLEEPLVEGHPFYEADQPPRMSWSRNCRLFYGEAEKGAYLPIREIASAIFRELKFEGWVSMELFSRRMADKEAEVPEELARRGAWSWQRLLQDMKLVDERDISGVSALL